MNRSTLTAAMLLLAAGTLSAQATKAPAAAPLKWVAAPPVFTRGAMMAVVAGDPMAAGPFVLQLKLPNGYKIMPHFHPTDETVEVISGTFMYAMGDTWKAADLKPMAKGDKGSIPTNMHHYAQAKGATVVQVTSTGPFVLTYVNPADDPSKAPAKAPAKAKAPSR